MPDKNTKRFNVELNIEESELFARLAKKLGRSKKTQTEWLIRKFIKDTLEKETFIN